MHLIRIVIRQKFNPIKLYKGESLHPREEYDYLNRLKNGMNMERMIDTK